MKSILLAGGAGYIGSHTAKLLAAEGFHPVVLDNLSTGNRSAVKWGPLIEGDVRDCSLVTNVIREYDIQAVMHLAASASVGESMHDPQKYFHNNVVGSLEFLQAIMSAGVKTIVFSSTCATYGDPLTDRISETHPQLPVNAYGESKLMVERALRWYDEAYGLKSVCLRYFNAAGADPDGEIGESHDPETHLIPLVIQTALGLRPRFDVYGEDYPTPDGTAVRDFVHVNDIARAHLLALRHLFTGHGSKSLNLGAGEGQSVKQVIRKVEELSGRKLPIRILGRRPGDPPRLVANPDLAWRVLRWRTSCSDLRDIIRTAWAWHSSGITRHSPATIVAASGA